MRSLKMRKSKEKEKIKKKGAKVHYLMFFRTQYFTKRPLRLIPAAVSSQKGVLFDNYYNKTNNL